jgi:phosphoglycerate dehydrogenase-like enzyme
MTDLRQCCVLVTPTSFGRDDPRAGAELEAAVGKVLYNPTDRPLPSAALRELLPGCHGYIAGLDTIDRAALSKADRLKVIARYGADAATKAGHWPRLSGIALEGKVVGLIGPGAIGRQMARRLHGFDCRLVAHDPEADAEFARTHEIRLLPMDDVIARADFLSLHLRGAALDAFSREPPGPDNPLLALPNVIATPHTGAHTDGAANAMGWGALRGCLAVLRGEAPAHAVT